MEERSLTRLNDRIKTDIFDWDEDFTLPDGLVDKEQEVEERVRKDNHLLEEDEEESEGLGNIAALHIND